MGAKRLYEIDVVPSRQAALCSKSHACLTNADFRLCKLDRVLSGNATFLTCLNDKTCIYGIRFGDSYICTCPVRGEIHRKFQV